MKKLFYFLILIIVTAKLYCFECEEAIVWNTCSYKQLPEILLENKKMIPTLIEKISIDNIGFIGFLNPQNSNIPNNLLNREGIIYAYAIEYILTKDTLEIVDRHWSCKEDSEHWDALMKPYKIYDLGVIAKKDYHGNIVPEALSKDDIINIQKMYNDWWQENKHKSIEILRDEYRSGKKILNYPYVWI